MGSNILDGLLIKFDFEIFILNFVKRKNKMFRKKTCEF